MAEAAITASDGLWQQIRSEAQRAADADPVFGTALARTILAHDDFAAALADLIGQRLGSGTTGRTRFTSYSRDAFQGEPDLIETASRDLQAIALRDPAITDLLPPLLHYKGYVALQAWRVSNWLWRHDHRDAALLFQNEASNLLADQHSSGRIHWIVRLSRPRHRHRDWCECGDRRRGHHPPERQHRPSR